MDDLVTGDRVEVGLHAAEVVDVVLLALTEQLLDARCAVAVKPVARDVVRVGGVDDLVVRRDEVALVGVDELGQLVVGDPALPLEVTGPAGLGQVGAVALPDRDPADHLVADRSVPVRPDEVGDRHRHLAQHLDELRPTARLQHAEVGGRDRGLVQRSPAEGERLLVVRAEGLVHDRPVMGHADLVALRPVLTADGDQLLDQLERALLALEFVALLGDPLDEEVLDVSQHVGEGEGNVVVLAERDSRQPRDGGAAAEPAAQLEADLVPDARHPAGQVWVAREQGAAGRRAGRGDRPVVGAARRGGQPDLVAHAPDLLRQPQAVAVEALARMEHDRVSLRIGGVDPGRSLLAELADQIGSQELALPVRREAEGEQLAPRQHVGRAPGLELEAQQLKLRRGRRGDPRRLVEAGAVGVQQRPQVGIELRLLTQRGPAEPEGAHQPVDRQSGRPGDLADPAGGDATVDLALPEPVLAVAEALPVPEVRRGLGLHRRHAPTVANDLDPALEPVDPQVAARAGEGTPEELPPEPGRGPAEERAADPHALGAGSEQAA
jgi:hypothetical protein